jgi:hypothetical protein
MGVAVGIGITVFVDVGKAVLVGSGVAVAEVAPQAKIKKLIITIDRTESTVGLFLFIMLLPFRLV